LCIPSSCLTRDLVPPNQNKLLLAPDDSFFSKAGERDEVESVEVGAGQQISVVQSSDVREEQ
jgi:hypothetical protein